MAEEEEIASVVRKSAFSIMLDNSSTGCLVQFVYLQNSKSIVAYIFKFVMIECFDIFGGY
jgi:hypothetical protein